MRHGGRAGLRAEAAAFAKCTQLPVHQALVHMFFAQRTTKNVRFHCSPRARLSLACAFPATLRHRGNPAWSLRSWGSGRWCSQSTARNAGAGLRDQAATARVPAMQWTCRSCA